MDERRELLCVFIAILLFGSSLPVSAPKSPECDFARVDHLHEGNIGEVEHFPWLGLLRVHLHELGELKIAVTGLVLVKSAYAIANADDISKIPKMLFKHDSKAMFIPKRGEPWFIKPKDYMVHPEYEFSTYNTIALVELMLEGKAQVPFKPVCWPGKFFNTSNQLYALGYTDENKLMEKTLYSLQYVKPSLCDEFYNRVGFSEPKTSPTYVQCGYATNNKNDCHWENGMALASNASGVWTLIGFGLRGPGCSAPARFIDMSEYFPWVESATDLEQVNDYPDFRRKTALGVGFRRTDNLPEILPSNETAYFREQYPGIDPGWPRDYKVYQLDPRANMFWIFPPNAEEAQIGPVPVSAEDQKEYEMPAQPCTTPKILVYRERLKLVNSQEREGTLTYRVTLHDSTLHNYTCLKLKVGNVVSKFPVKFWFFKAIDQYEGGGFNNDAVADTPYDLFRLNPLPPKYQTQNINKTTGIWNPPSFLEPKHVVDTSDWRGVKTINIILGFHYVSPATMNLYVYGYPVRKNWPRETTTTTEASTSTSEFIYLPRRNLMYPMSDEGIRRGRKNRLERARERIADREAIRFHTMSEQGYV